MARGARINGRGRKMKSPLDLVVVVRKSLLEDLRVMPLVLYSLYRLAFFNKREREIRL